MQTLVGGAVSVTTRIQTPVVATQRTGAWRWSVVADTVVAVAVPRDAARGSDDLENCGCVGSPGIPRQDFPLERWVDPWRQRGEEWVCWHPVLAWEDGGLDRMPTGIPTHGGADGGE